jgi:hypothetical protein
VPFLEQYRSLGGDRRFDIIDLSAAATHAHP